MSGSGAYYINTDSSGFDLRYVQAVCSNGRVDNSAGFYVLLRDSMIGDLNSYREQTRECAGHRGTRVPHPRCHDDPGGIGRAPMPRPHVQRDQRGSAEPRRARALYLSTHEVVIRAHADRYLPGHTGADPGCDRRDAIVDFSNVPGS